MLIGIYLFLIIQLLIVAYYDLKTTKISNSWMISNIVLYLVLVFIFPDQYSITFSTFAWPVGFFIAGFVLFLLKIMGGGDSKYLATFFLLVPQVFHDEMFFSLALSTTLIGGSIFIKNLLKNLDRLIIAYKTMDVSLVKGVFGQKFAYAPVILISWLWFGFVIKDKLIWY